MIGYDQYIEYNNPYGTYSNDGLNPCINDEFYGTYIADQLDKNPPSWDYVVLADQTKRVAIESARNNTLKKLEYKYAPMLNESGAIPVIVNPHAFYSSKTNMTGLGDVPTFTAHINKGTELYASTLAKALDSRQRPIIAQVGFAFLTVWEENYDLWELLFTSDLMHASVYGTYLISCVLYMTLYRHRLPDTELSLLPENVYLLFQNSRKLVGGQVSFPTTEEALYLQDVARRVSLKGYVPSSFVSL